MDNFKVYKPVLLSFIFHLNKKNLVIAKKQIIDVLSKSVADERAYVYSPNQKQIPKRMGGAVAQISRFTDLGYFSIGKAMKHTLLAISLVDEDTEKYVFVITDGYKHDKMQFSISQALKIDAQLDVTRVGSTNFIFCTMNDSAGIEQLNVKHIPLENMELLGSIVADSYRRSGVILSDLNKELDDNNQNSETSGI
jgi:hypothetical protein